MIAAKEYKSAAAADKFFAAQTGDANALDQLVQQNLPLVKYIVRRFLGRGKEYDDLFQTGCIGLIKAIRKFDCTLDVRFSTYAVPLIMGEIRRLLRDDNTMHISRSLHDLSVKILHFQQNYEMQHEEAPPLEEICHAVGAEKEQILLALNASQPIKSLTEPLGNSADVMLGDVIPGKSGMNGVDERITLEGALGKLTQNEQILIRQRFFERRTQKDVGQHLGMTQVQISRMESRVLHKLRSHLDENSTKRTISDQSP